MMKRIHFPGLNGIRFFAAFMVIVEHTELYKGQLGYVQFWVDSYGAHIGDFGVTMFFVLSGFLITFLLFTEKAQKSKINIKHFYVRRILRIWPLYFWILVLAFFLVPHIGALDFPSHPKKIESFGPTIFLYIALLANVAFVYLPKVPFANVLWSVAVEEQFYLVWPHIVKIKKHFLRIVFCLLAGLLLSKLFCLKVFPDSPIYSLLHRTRFYAMLFGAIAAYLVYTRSFLLKYIYSSGVQVLALVLFFLLLFDIVPIYYVRLFNMELSSMVIGLVIMNIASNKRSIVKLENKVLNYLGKVSYGLYVYHLFAVVLCLKYVPQMLGMNELNTWVNYPLVLLSIMALTIGISHLSFTYFEKPFLKMKVHFSTVLSGDLAQPETNNEN